MKKLLVFTLSLLLIFLFGCAVKGPSNKEIKDLIYGVYLREASVISKEECKGTDYWLVYYLFKGDNRPYGWLLEKMPDGQLIPYGMPKPNQFCPK